MASTLNEIREMIADCEARESQLSDWERHFLDDIAAQLARGSFLSDRQDEKLQQIWERVT